MKFLLNLRKPYLHLGVFVLSCVIGSVTAWHLGQDLNWDLLNYHFYNPWAFLHNRLTFDIQPASLGSYLNPLLDLPNYLLRTHFRPIFAGLILGAVQGINIWLVFEIALIMLKDFIQKVPFRFTIALIIGVFSLFGSASLSEMGNSMCDNLTSILILSSLLFLLISTEEKKTLKLNPKQLRTISYLLAGLSVGLKLTSVVYVVPLLIAGLVGKRELRIKIKDSLWNAFMITVGTIASGGFWYLNMWQHFKSPIFPFYNTIFKSSYYPQTNLIDYRWFPKSLIREIFYPFTFAKTQNIAAEPFFRDPRFAVLLVAIAVAIVAILFQKLVLKRQKLFKPFSKSELIFWIFIILSYILWESEFSYYRYILTIELLALTGLALIIFRLFRNINIASGVMVLLFCVINYFTVPLNWGRIPWQIDNFGPNLRQQLNYVNGTVLLPVENPLAFLVPYFSPGTRAVDVIGWTKAQQELIAADIHEDTAVHKNFYAVETTNALNELENLRVVGFTNGICQPIDTYAGQYLYNQVMQYKICTLVYLTADQLKR